MNAPKVTDLPEKTETEQKRAKFEISFYSRHFSTCSELAGTQNCLEIVSKPPSCM
jgi:hypothetical protein